MGFSNNYATQINTGGSVALHCLCILAVTVIFKTNSKQKTRAARQRVLTHVGSVYKMIQYNTIQLLQKYDSHIG